MFRRLRLERLEERRVMAADFNGDATVDGLDLAQFQSGFGITSGATPELGDANGDGSVNGLDLLQWQREAGPKQPNLIAYRPQGVQSVANPIDAPFYSPFRKKPVREADETNNFVGPGIRVNRDDDNANGITDEQESGVQVSRENDLIEVKVERMPGQGNLALTAGSQLSVYYNYDKETPVPFVDGKSESLPFVNDAATVFVEWKQFGHGFANLNLVDPATMNVVDSVRFHSFKSLAIVFGGNGQNPQDTDGDGSIGDFIDGGPNREGVFDMAQFLYDTGWDVLPFNEEDATGGDDVPYQEAVSASVYRLVDPLQQGGISVIGYSQGGGATHDLIERLQNEAGIITSFGVYLDAVQFNNAFAETDWPDGVLHLFSFYQTNSLLRGGEIDPNDVTFGSTLDQFNLTDDPDPQLAALTHFTIDDNLAVLNTIIAGLNQFQDR